MSYTPSIPPGKNLPRPHWDGAAGWVADAAHRLGCLAIFAAAAVPVVMACFSTPQDMRLQEPAAPSVAIAVLSAAGCGILGGLLWLALGRRDQGRGLAMLAIVLLGWSALMIWRPVRMGLAAVGQDVNASLQPAGEVYGR